MPILSDEELEELDTPVTPVASNPVRLQVESDEDLERHTATPNLPAAGAEQDPSHPDYWDSVLYRLNEIGSQIVESPLSTALKAPFSFAGSIIENVPGALEITAKGGAEVLGGFIGTVETLSQTGPGAKFNPLGFRPLFQGVLDFPAAAAERLKQQHSGKSFSNLLVENVEQGLTDFAWTPVTESGRNLEGVFIETFGTIDELAKRGGDIVFENAMEFEPALAPALGTAARMIPDAAMTIVGFKLGKSQADKMKAAVEEAAAKKARGETPDQVFDENVTREFQNLSNDEIKRQDLLLAEQSKIRETPYVDRTPEQKQKLAEVEGELEALAAKQFKVTENTLLTTMRPEDVLESATAEQLKKVDSEVFVSQASDGGVTEPIVLRRDGSELKIVSGLESAAAAKVLGNDKVPVRIEVERIDPATQKTLSDQLATVRLAADQRKEQLARKRRLSPMEMIATMSFDSRAAMKNRLLKEFGPEANQTIRLYELLNHSSTSGGIFVRQYVDDLFSKVSPNEVLFERKLGNGKSETITSERALDIIAREKIVRQIAKRKSNQKFEGKKQPIHFKADIDQLRGEIGPAKFAELEKLANELVGPNGAYNQLLQMRLEAGLISQAGFNRMKNFDYEPTRYLDLLDPVVDRLDGARVTLRQSGVEELAGGSYDLTEISARQLFIDSAFRVHKQIATNKASLNLAKLADDNPKNPLVRHLSDKADVPPGLVEINYWKDGVKKRLAVDPVIGDGWRYSSPEMTNLAANALKWASGTPLVKGSAVGFNPSFFLVDMPRNITHMMLAAGKTLDGDKLYASNLDFVPGLAPIARGAQIAVDFAQVAKDATFHTGLFKELAENNAFPHFLADIGQEDFGKASRHPGVRGDSRLKKIGSAMAWLNRWSETMMRMSIANRALKQQEIQGRPRDIVEAAHEASRVIDYGQAGRVGRVLDHTIPFLNPAIQATRTSARGFKEDPARASMLTASVAMWSGYTYMYNYMVNPEAVEQIPDEKWATGFNYVFPPWMTKALFDTERPIDKNGNPIHPYLHIPIDNLYMPVVGGMNWIMRHATTGQKPSQPVADLIKNAVPISPTGSIPPTIDAMVKLYGNLDMWTGKEVFPGADRIADYAEFFPEHDRRATDRFYVWWGSALGESGLVRDSALLEPTSSPERVKSVVNTFIAGNPVDRLWSEQLEPLLFGPTEFQQNRSGVEAFAAQPFITRLVKFTHPDINAFRSARGPSDEFNAVKKLNTDKMDAWAEKIARGEMQLQTAETFIRDSAGIPKDEKKRMAARLKAGIVFQRVSKSIPRKDRIGMPSPVFFLSMAERTDPRDRALIYYEEWVRKGPEQRAAMERIARTMSTRGLGARFFDRNDVFRRELERLKRVHGTEPQPSFIDKVGDFVTPWLKERGLEK